MKSYPIARMTFLKLPHLSKSNMKNLLLVITAFITLTLNAQTPLPPIQSYHLTEAGKIPKARYNLDGQGRMNGTAYSYNQNGELFEISNWKNGVPNGQYIYYGDPLTKKIKDKGNYINGKKEGYWIENYDEKGSYKNGQRVGQWTTSGGMFNNGTATGKIVNGLKEGVWKGIKHEYKFYIFGTLKFAYGQYYKDYKFNGLNHEFRISMSKNEFEQEYGPKLIKFLETFLDNPSWKWAGDILYIQDVRDEGYATEYRNGEIVKVFDIKTGDNLTEMYRKLLSQLLAINTVEDCNKFLSSWQGDYNELVELCKTGIASKDENKYFQEFSNLLDTGKFQEAIQYSEQSGISQLPIFKRGMNGNRGTIYELLTPGYSGLLSTGDWKELEIAILKAKLGYDLNNVVKQVESNFTFDHMDILVKSGVITEMNKYNIYIYPINSNTLQITQGDNNKVIHLNSSGNIESIEAVK